MANKSEWFRIVYEGGALWIDGVKKRSGVARDFVIKVIEAEVGEGVDTLGFYEVRDGVPCYHPEETREGACDDQLQSNGR